MVDSENINEIYLRPLVWMGDSRKNIRSFPDEVKVLKHHKKMPWQWNRRIMTEIIFEESSGNVFADLDFDNADEMLMRGKIGIQVIKLLKSRSLKQREIGELLGIAQPEVSHLMNGEFQRFSEGKLLMFLKRLDKEITLHIRDRSIAPTHVTPVLPPSPETRILL
jgi:predicted XRE-type DNA-binding protein